MLFTLPIREVLPSTPRTRIVRIDLLGERFSYIAGQALLIGTHAHDPRRPYSIAIAPEDAERDGCLEFLVGVDGQGVAGPHLTLEAGAVIDVDGPFGHFTFPTDSEEERFIFIAGGTGIAPLRAMLRHALHVRHREIGLFYSVRTPDDFAYEQEWQSLACQKRIEFRQTVTRETPLDRWTGGRGRITRDHLAPLVHDPATRCFICGPPALVDEIPKLLQDLGIPPYRIKVDEWL